MDKFLKPIISLFWITQWVYSRNRDPCFLENLLLIMEWSLWIASFGEASAYKGRRISLTLFERNLHFLNIALPMRGGSICLFLGQTKGLRCDVTSWNPDSWIFPCNTSFQPVSAPRSCTRDEGRPLGAGLQGQAPNRLKLLWSNARVVSVKEKALWKVSGEVQGGERKRTTDEVSKWN